MTAPGGFRTPFPLSIVNASGVGLAIHTFRIEERVVVVVGHAAMLVEEAEIAAESAMRDEAKVAALTDQGRS